MRSEEDILKVGDTVTYAVGENPDERVKKKIDEKKKCKKKSLNRQKSRI